ncbi:MAG: polysulfide reductase NrfD [Magnetococcales bacterium]|nr:polysulfide reductase NrfD [Magnetococcales bacterium]
MSRLPGRITGIAVLVGLLAWFYQLQGGLQLTGMNNQLLWGLYIGNFIYLVGIAASAVILVVPVHFFAQRQWALSAVVGECLALMAVAAALLFVTVDLGRPWLFFHGLPGLGTLHFPASIMSWDLLVLVAYLLLNGLLLLRFLLTGRSPASVPWMVLAAVLGIAIHTVTAFLLAANPARPFWHSPLLAPRFIASAFASGSALMILIFYQIKGAMASVQLLNYLVRVMTVTLLIHFFLLAAELFVLFYHPTDHGHSARLFYTGLDGSLFHGGWAWWALSLQGMALLLVRWSRAVPWAALLLVIGVWMEKGPGLVVPAFVPTALGEVAFYRPSWVEWTISAAIMVWGVSGLIWLVRKVLRRWPSHAADVALVPSQPHRP